MSNDIVIFLLIFSVIILLARVLGGPYAFAPKGAYGEYLVREAILKLSPYNKILQNLYIPTRNGSTEIDVVWVSRKGIFVFESKNYSGWIFGSEDSEQWMQIIYDERRQFYNPVKQNKTHIYALQKLIKEKIDYYNIIVFSNRCEFKELNIKSNNVFVINYNNIHELISAIWNSSEDMLSEDDADRVYNFLGKYTAENVDPSVIEEHDRYVQSKAQLSE